ncbi:MAG: amidohydrolase [Spirochaetota bacterium]|nr:amidohydrolase [Spirochaetota bacterium]
MKNYKKLIIFSILLVLCIAIIAYLTDGYQENDNTSILLFNGNIITVDSTTSKPEAVFIKGSRIYFTGTLQDARKLTDASTITINLKGRTLIPGFNDNHTHTLAAGSFYSEAILWNKTCEEIAVIISQEAKTKKPGELISGNSWDYTTCPKPHKSLLDKAAPNNPVFLTQYSGHAAWVNSRMLEEMGIDKNTPDPKGGQIVRDEKGEPTGILRDTAMGTSEYGKFIKQILSPSLHKKLITKALTLYKEAGITSVQDNTWEPFTVRLLKKYRNSQELSTRFTCWPMGNSPLYYAFTWFASFDKNDYWVRKGLVKYFADGAFSTRTAWLSQEYADEPGNFGSPRYTTQELETIVMEAAKEKQQITFHAIGDRAVTEVLNAVEKAQAVYPWTNTLRFRIEHIQIINPNDIQRMKNLGIVACVQPFTLCNPKKDETLLGKARAKKAYMFYSIYKAGIPVAFGSDIPAEVDYQPLLGIYYAVTRKSKDGTMGPLNKDECFSPYEALYCYTMGSAYAEFMENEKGSITKGKLADFVVLSDNLITVPVHTIKDIKVLMTITGGRIVYKHNDF